MYRGHTVIDGHTHYILDLAPEYFVSLLDRTGVDMAHLASIAHGDRLCCTPELLALKARYPGRFYVSAGLNPCEYYRGGEDMGARLAEYARRQLACGCDGIKLLEGKPQLRRALPIPDFDLPCWEAFWRFAEESGTPLLWHVNDPEEFWDKSRVPLWAVDLGWGYDETYINNEAQYAQVLAVLARHPKLKVTFAHMFFMSAQLERLSAILDAYPNVRVDLTPGIEMYENLSHDGTQTRAFFEKYNDRIIYGTDICSRYVYTPTPKPFNEAENLRRGEIVRDFLFNAVPERISADGNFVRNRPDFIMDCLGLSGERLDAVMSKNFLALMGGAPRPVDIPLSLTECAFIRAEHERALAGGLRSDISGVERAEKCLSAI